MFNNSTNIDASHSTFSEVHQNQYYNSRVSVQGNQTVNTVVHGNQILQGSQTGLAAYDSAERYPAPRCLEGTRVQLLERLTRWMDDENEKPICWVNGRPGSGKSAVSQTIAENYASQKRLAASFFFSRRDIERRTTRHFFPTIATQFLSSIPSIRPAVMAALEQDYMIPSKVLREQMQKLLIEPLSSGLEPPASPLLIIVDALDECDDARLVSELVSLLVQLLRDSLIPFRLLITSRSEPWLQAHFRRPEMVSHALDEVCDQHPNIMQQVSRPWPSSDDLDRIVVKFVGDGMHNPVHRLQAILEDQTSRESAYADLDALYLDAISVFPDADTVRLILGIVYCTPVPVAVPALHKLLARPDVDARIVIPALGSVLLSSENGEQPIQFYHASFRDFLYCIDPILCFRTMVKSLKRNMCAIDDSSKLNRDIEDLQERRRIAYDEALVYACRYWAHHVTQLPSRGNSSATLQLLYWIEASSIFNDIENAVIELRAGLTWIKSLENVPKDTATLLEDAERLVLLYREPISQCALHVYHTAITFAPSSSALYSKFKHDAGTLFTITHSQDDEWLPYQYALDLGSINSVAFSPSGDIVATAASLGDRSGSSLLVRFSLSGAFVAAAFGNCVGREHLKDADPHSDKITCLEFSPDNTLLASGARDHTIQLWSLDTAQRLHKLVAHEGPVTSLAFTSDSQSLCSGSEDNLLILWDAKSGKVVRGMMGHRGAIKSLSVSRDGNMIATASEDNSGSCTRTISKGHQKPLRSVQFFEDDKRVISASDATILVSNLIKKIEFGFVEYARGDDVKRPVFSPDSSSFAWSMSDIWERESKTSVRVYDSTSGSHKFRFNGLKKVQAFVSSTDGNLVACGHEGAITVCDVGQGVKRAMCVVDSPSITALAFSSDSQTLLSISSKGLMQTWDPSSGTCQTTVEGHSSPVTAVAFRAVWWDDCHGSTKMGPFRLLSPTMSASHELAPSGREFTQKINFFKFSDDCLSLTCRAEDGTLFSAAPEGGENKVSCTLCEQQEESSANAVPKSLPHLISQSDKQSTFDCLLRTTYVIRKDGWVCRDDKRVFWLPQHLRPSKGENNMLAAAEWQNADFDQPTTPSFPDST
ncbi:hypothetical protein BU15DRAFT_87660 [Melanogaster broomeanus]|nr:hypothetical protein BU15DRAFT_87660 [Melanogaster broomeanus]